MAALRLVCPFSVESSLSLIPSAETLSPEAVQFDPHPTITSGVPAIDGAVDPVISGAFSADELASVNPLYVFTFVMACVWLLGAAALLVYALVSAGRLRKKLSTAILLRDNIYESEVVDSPFVFGAVKPKIYLPMHMDEGTATHVIAHERAHLARRDHWWKIIGYLVLTLHWCNPLVWLAYALFCRDIELACDERVIKELDAGGRADYSQALLSCAAPKRVAAACPLAFGEGNLKARVKSALSYKKPAFPVVAAAVLAVVLVAVCFLTNPKSKGSGLAWAQKLNAADVASIEVCTFQQEIDRRYKKLDAGEREQAIAFINGSRGTYAEEAETVYGGLPVWFLITMNDGTLHAVGSVSGHYLIIDGDTFDMNADDQAEWERYTALCDSAGPGDMADRLSYALYGMPTGVYLLGEAVFDDPSWAKSYEEMFAEVESVPELWFSSVLGADMSGFLFGTESAGRGYIYRFSEWEKINLTASNFDRLFRSESGEDWNDTSAAELRRENAHAWCGTRTGEDINATTPLEGYLREDELSAMDQWLLLQQKDGSMYLVMGYRGGTYPYRWVVRLSDAVSN